MEANTVFPRPAAYSTNWGLPWGGYGWTGYGWTGLEWGWYGWNPLFFGDGYFCDPSNLMLYGAPACFLPGAYLYGFDPFFGYDPFFVNFDYVGPFSSTNLLFGSSFLGPNCLLCPSFGFNPFLPGSLAVDPYLPGFGTSVSISKADLPGLVPTTSAPESAAGTTSEATPYTYAKPAATNQPVTLVLVDGTKIEATKYTLAPKGMLRYVTTGGQTETIPLMQIDIQATMKANADKGVDFLVPATSRPAPLHHADGTTGNPS